MLIGAALGVAVAVFWMLVLFLTHAPKVEFGKIGRASRSPLGDFSWRDQGLGCLLLLALGGLMVGGFILGSWVGGPPGSVVGLAVGYLAPFVGFGVYVQRTVGATAWLGIETAPPKPPE